MNSDVKLCPFCGSAAIVWMQAGHAHYLECSHCGGRIRPHIDKAEAIEAWNRRAEPERKKGKWVKEDLSGYFTPGGNSIYHCSECGHVEGPYPCPRLTNFCPNCGADMRGK